MATTDRPPTDADFAPSLGADQTVQAVQTTTVGYIPLTVVTADGDLIIGTGLQTVTRLGVGAVGSILDVVGTEPAWLAPGARGSILEVGASSTGWLPIGSRGALLYAGANDPTYLAIGAAGGVLYAGSSDPAWTAAGSAGGIFYSAGAAAPVWSASGSAGTIFYNLSNGTPSWLAAGGAGTLLYNNGASTPAWLGGGAVGTILYNSAANTPAWLGTGTSTYVLTSNGAAAPSWQALPSSTLTVDNNGTLIGSRSILNLIPGTGIALTVADNAGAARVDVTITDSVASSLTTVGDIPYLSAVTPTYSRLAAGAAGTVMVGTGTGAAPKYLAAGSAGQILTSAGAADPVWNSASLAYTEFTANVSTTITAESIASTVVTATAVSFDGATPCWIEFYTPHIRVPGTAGALVTLVLYDGSSSIGQLGVASTPAAVVMDVPALLRRRLTPSNASHTYSIRAFVSSGTGTIFAGAGGSGNLCPGYISIVRA